MCLWCGVLGRVNLAAHHILYRANEAHLFACILQNLLNEECSGGFAVGAGKADQLQLLCRVAVIIGTNGCIGIPGIGGNHLAGQPHIVVTNHGNGALFQHFCRHGVAVKAGALDAHKQIPRLHQPRVLGHIQHLHIVVGAGAGDPLQQFGYFHCDLPFCQSKTDSVFLNDTTTTFPWATIEPCFSLWR